MSDVDGDQYSDRAERPRVTKFHQSPHRSRTRPRVDLDDFVAAFADGILRVRPAVNDIVGHVKDHH